MSRLKVDSLLDCKIITFRPHNDERGYFYEPFNKEVSDIVNFWPAQESMSRSHRNVIRGLHLQHTPPLAKLVRVLVGKIQDVVVDCQDTSATYGQHKTITLTDELPQWLYVPAGYAHGFCVISDYAIVDYLFSDVYNPKGEISLNPFSPKLSISWCVERDLAILSDKDKNSMKFEDYFK